MKTQRVSHTPNIFIPHMSQINVVSWVMASAYLVYTAMFILVVPTRNDNWKYTAGRRLRGLRVGAVTCRAKRHRNCVVATNMNIDSEQQMYWLFKFLILVLPKNMQYPKKPYILKLHPDLQKHVLFSYIFIIINGYP